MERKKQSAESGKKEIKAYLLKGKGIIHDNWQVRGEKFLEYLVEFGKGMADARKGRIVYINVLNNLSTSCDCDASAPPPVFPE